MKEIENVQQTDMPEGKNAYQKSGNYSVHTFEIKIPLPKETAVKYRALLDMYCTENRARTAYRNKNYYELKKKRYVRSIFANCFTCYDNLMLFEKGISDICFMEQKIIGGFYDGGTCAQCVTFQVNPRILLGHQENKYICIVPAKEAGDIMPELIKAWKPYGFVENDLRLAVVKRIDICANISLGGQYLVERYLQLLRKGGYYMGLNHKKTEYDNIAHRMKYPDNEVSYINKNTSKRKPREELSIYLKYSQMEDKKDFYSPEETECAKGQLRFELRIGSDKVSYLERKYDCGIPSDLISLAGTMGTDILAKYLVGLYGSGKFLRHSEALNIIKNARKHRLLVRNTMEEIVQQTRKTDMADAFERLPHEKRYRYRYYFNELGISPITFPDSWEEKEFENPVTYIMTNNVNER